MPNYTVASERCAQHNGKGRSASKKVQLTRGQSAALFNGKVSIALIAVSFEGEPLRYKWSHGRSDWEGKQVD